MAPVALTRVAEMDQEHDACVTALNALARSLSIDTLQAVQSVLTDHFAHEEKLLDNHVYDLQNKSSSQQSFSMDGDMRRTHMADHARMLSNVAQQLRVGTVTVAFVRSLMSDFSLHAERYDSYGDRLLAALG
jgi:hemerythrin